MSANPIDPAWPVAAIDLHQHLWPEPLRRAAARPHPRAVPARLDAVHRRRAAVRRRAGGPRRDARRIATDPATGSGWRASASRRRSGIESLPRDEAAALLRRLARRRGRAARPLRAPGRRSRRVEPDLDGLAGLLDGGLRRGAAARRPTLATPAGWRAARRGAAGRRAGRQAGVRAPRARPADPGRRRCRRGGRRSSATSRQLQAAWWAWHAVGGRSQFPTLRLVFAAGAGLAPLHHERLAARGGTLGPVDPRRVRRHLVVRPAGRSTPWSGRSASTRSCSAATGRTPSRIGDAARRRRHPG